MRILMLSKACIVGQYQSKLEELATHKDLELMVVVPPYWRDERGVTRLERSHTRGYSLQVTPMSFNGSFHLHYYPQLPLLSRSFQPDIIHIDEEPYNFATFHAMRIAERDGACTLFFTWQNIQRRYPMPFSILERYAYARSNYAIAGSHGAADVLRAKHFLAPIATIPQFGVDPKEFAPASQMIGDDVFHIGFAGGRLVEEKGVQVLLNAVVGLNGGWQLHIIGEGPYKSHLKSQARSLRIENRVIWEPRRGSTKMPEFYRSMSTLVLPSLTRKNWKEQFGRVLIEAMACEVPVVGSDCGEIPNVIGDAGIIFSEGNVDALRAHLAELMSDASRRSTLGKAGRARVLAHFTQAHVADATYRVYCEVMKMKNRAHVVAPGGEILAN